MRSCLPEVGLGVDGTLGGRDDIARICSKTKMEDVNIVDSIPQRSPEAHWSFIFEQDNKRWCCVMFEGEEREKRIP